MSAALDWWRLREMKALGLRLVRAPTLAAAERIAGEIGAGLVIPIRDNPAPAGSAALSLAEDGVPDWREHRRRLRLAGHEVKQFDGRVLVDGVPSTDPRLSP